MATQTPTTTQTAVHGGYSPPMAPLAARFESAMAAIDEQIEARRGLPSDEGDPLVDAAATRLDEISAEIAGVPLQTGQDAEVALHAVAWLSGARTVQEVSERLSPDTIGVSARLLDALFARALAA